MQGLFPGTSSPPDQSSKIERHKRSVTTCWLTNINVIPIDYAFRPRLRDRLTLRRLTLRRNPWTFGDTVFHSVCRYSCQHSHFRRLQEASRLSLRRANGTLRYRGRRTEDGRRNTDNLTNEPPRACSCLEMIWYSSRQFRQVSFVDVSEIERIARPNPHLIRRSDRHPDKALEFRFRTVSGDHSLQQDWSRWTCSPDASDRPALAVRSSASPGSCDGSQATVDTLAERPPGPQTKRPSLRRSSSIGPLSSVFCLFRHPELRLMA